MSVGQPSTSLLDSTEVRNPATGAVVGSPAALAPEAVADAVRSLRGEQAGRESLGPRRRAEWLRVYRDWLLDHEARKYCRQQAITAPRLPTLRSEPLWYRYSGRRAGIVARLLRFLVARDRRRRVGAAPSRDGGRS